MTVEQNLNLSNLPEKQKTNFPKPPRERSFDYFKKTDPVLFYDEEKERWEQTVVKDVNGGIVFLNILSDEIGVKSWKIIKLSDVFDLCGGPENLGNAERHLGDITEWFASAQAKNKPEDKENSLNISKKIIVSLKEMYPNMF